MPERLSWSARERLARIAAQAGSTRAASIQWPNYLRKQISPGIVHLGVGNFHRAHQAACIDAVLGSGQHQWGIVGVSLRRADMRDALTPQQGLYTLVEQGPAVGQSQIRVIGALQQLLVAPESPAAVIAAIADPQIHWVTLTITEKGYGLNAQCDGPDFSNPDIAHDAEQFKAVRALPRSAAGLLLQALQLRRATGAPPLTMMSCDNLANNGLALQRLLDGLAQHCCPSLRGYLESKVSFPATMVDRIVPHTSNALREQILEQCGLIDAWPVATERFTQWVIEDRFAGAMPDFARAGLLGSIAPGRASEAGRAAVTAGTNGLGPAIELVADVQPFEAMKLRLLNAAHSAIAYLAVPAGWQTVDVAIAQPALRTFVQRLWRNEVIPGLPAQVQPLAPAYAQALLSRFDNAALAHKTEQIAIDGSQKIPLRWLPSLQKRLDLGLPIDSLALCIAAWCHFLRSSGEAINDPLADQLRRCVAAPAPAQRVTQLLSERRVFGESGASPALQQAVTTALVRIESQGVQAALAAVNAG